MRYIFLFILLLVTIFGGLVYFLFPSAKGPLSILDAPPLNFAAVIHDPKETDAQIYLAYLSGEIDNPYGQGLAHIVEHFAWNAMSNADPKGAGHDRNAFTNGNAITYFESGSPEKTSDIVKRLLITAQPLTISTDQMEKERKIVTLEYNTRISNPLAQSIRETVNNTLFANTPYLRQTIGTLDDIASYSRDEVTSFHAASHRLDNAALVIITPDTADDVAEKILPIFADIASDQASSFAQLPPISKLPTENTKRLEIDDTLPQAVEMSMLLDLADICPDLVKCLVLSELMYDAIDHPLGQIAADLRYDHFIAKEFTHWAYFPRPDILHFGIRALPDTGIDLTELETALNTSLASLAKNGIDPDQFEKLKSARQEDFDDPEDHADIQSGLIYDALILRSAPITLADYQTALSNIQATDLNALLAQIASPHRSVSFQFYRP